MVIVSANSVFVAPSRKQEINEGHSNENKQMVFMQSLLKQELPPSLEFGRNSNECRILGKSKCEVFKCALARGYCHAASASRLTRSGQFYKIG